ncbi:uncharacterized protein LOC133780072 [Humulus lupulus]|uniref:uncharacterized protein LOC133780072 n=1 Tax=Humulus lupulus TaxID=3486 RepID=UPI002B40EEFF|nr:uncharacterized protein LOC133780072 [Humulus lupulus]
MIAWNEIFRILLWRFDILWRRWKKGCLTSVSYSVYVNGKPRGKFGASHGFRQGDPLSSFLFTLVTDVLGSLVDKAKTLSLFRGFSVGNDKISLQKCQLLGLNVEEEVVNSRASVIGCEVGKWPMKYLGLLLGDNLRIKPFGCQFWLSVLKELLKVFLKVLERMIHDFLLEGVDLSGSEHMIAWDVVCKPLFHGGLGIGNLKERNEAFLLKWLWRFSLECNSLWHKVVLSHYGRAENLWDTKVVERFFVRGPWKDISSLYGEYLGLVHFKVGRGDSVKFWVD